MFRFSFQVEPDEVQFDRGFSRFGEGLDDYMELWPDLIADFENIEKKQFKSEGKSGSIKWAKLSKKYARKKKRLYPGKKILDRTGALNAALTDSDAKGAIRGEFPKLLNMGVDSEEIPYAIYHQTGTERDQTFTKTLEDGSKYTHVVHITMPRRRPIELNEADKKRWGRIIHVFLKNNTQKVFAPWKIDAATKEADKRFGRLTA